MECVKGAGLKDEFKSQISEWETGEEIYNIFVIQVLLFCPCSYPVQF